MSTDCRSGKIGYTRRGARRAAKGVARRTGREQEPYKCPWCAAWHIATRKRVR